MMRHRIKKFESCWHFRDKAGKPFSNSPHLDLKRKRIKTTTSSTRLINETSKMMLTYLMVIFHIFMIQSMIVGVSSNSGKPTLKLHYHILHMFQIGDPLHQQ